MVAVIVKARHYFPRVERNFVKHRREILRLDDASVASGVWCGQSRAAVD